jgi:hypothetical protein
MHGSKAKRNTGKVSLLFSYVVLITGVKANQHNRAEGEGNVQQLHGSVVEDVVRGEQVQVAAAEDNQ